MNSIKSLAVALLALNAVATTPVLAEKAKNEYSKNHKRDKAVGTWLINTTYTTVKDFNYFGNLVLSEDGTFTLHTSFGLAAENVLPAAGLSSPGGNYSVLLQGSWKKDRKGYYTLCGASVITTKDLEAEGVPNVALARWTAEGSFKINKGSIEGSYTTTLYAPNDTKLESPLDLPQLETSFEGDKLCCKKKRK